MKYLTPTFHESHLDLSAQRHGKDHLEMPGETSSEVCHLDFLIDDKIILELKKGNRFFGKDIDQVYSYLKINNPQLGILANFTNHGVETKRIVNIN